MSILRKVLGLFGKQKEGVGTIRGSKKPSQDKTHSEEYAQQKSPSKEYTRDELFHFLENIPELTKALDEGLDPNVKETGHNISLLVIAAHNGAIEIVRLLIERGADPNGADIAKNTALHSAARHGHLDICELLVNSGADPNISENLQGHTPIFHAVTGEYKEILELLIKAGARTDLSLYSGTTLMDIAYKRGNEEIIAILNELA